MRILLFLICQLSAIKGFDTLCDPSETNYKNVTVVHNQINRYRRNDEPLDITINRMQILSRVTNAITLQQGLLDGTIPPYDVIAELLNFESVKSSEFLDPAANKVENVLESIKGLSEKLIKEKSVSNSEKTFQFLFEILEMINGVTDVSVWKLETSFGSDLTDLETTDFKMSDLNKIKEAIQNIKIDVGRVEKYLNSNKVKTTKVSLDEIVGHSENLISKSTDFTTNLESIVKLKSGKNATTSFSDMYKLSEAIKLFEKNSAQIKTSNDDTNAKIIKNVGFISEVSQDASTVLPYLETVKTLLSFSSPSKKSRHLIHTSGFQKGYDDLLLLETDKTDQWLTKKTDTNSLFQSLSPLQSLNNKVKEVSEKLIEISSEQPLPIDPVQAFLKDLVPSGSNQAEAGSVLEKTFKCIIPKLLVSTITVIDLKPIQEEIEKIDLEMSKTEKALRNVASFLKDEKFVSLINDVKTISAKATSDDEATLAAISKELLSNNRKTLSEEMTTEFEQLLNAVSTKPFKDLAVTVKTKLSVMTDFKKYLPEFKDMFVCLQALDFNDVYALKQIIEQSQKLQTPVAEPLKLDMEKVMKIVNSLQGMKDFSELISEMKKASQSKELSDNTLKSEHSKTIGTATAGIVNMKDLIEQQNQFDLIKKHVSLVESEIGAVTGLSLEDANNLKDLGKFENMQSELEKWKSGVKLPENEGLESYKSIFLDAKTVAGIDDVRKIADSVEKLESLVSDPAKKQDLKDLKAALDSLDSIGLKLSDYTKDFDGAPEALKQIDMFFANRNKKIDSSTPSNPAQVGTNGSLAVLDDDVMFGEAITEKPFYKQNWFIILCVCLFIAILMTGLAILACWYYEKFCFKSHQLEDDDDVEKQNTHPTETQTETKTPVTTSQVNENKVPEKNKTPEVPDEKKEEKSSKSWWSFLWTTKPVVPKWAVKKAEGFKTFVNGLCKDIALWQRTRAQHYENIYPENFLPYIDQEILKRVNLDPIRPKNRFVNQQRNKKLMVGNNPIFINQALFARCAYKDKFFFGCHFALPNTSKMYMTQLPIAPNNCVGRTDDKFFWMIGQIKMNAVVMICTEEELDFESRDYFPQEPKEVRTISKTGASKTAFTVECTAVEHLIPGIIIRRKLRIKFHDPYPEKRAKVQLPEKDRQNGDEYLCEDFDPNNIDHEFDHYQWLGWPAGSVPEDIGAAIRIMEEIRGLQNVVVHCLYGVERCASFVAMELARQKLYHQSKEYKGRGNINWIQLVNEIRTSRPDALESNIHVAFIMKVLVEMTKKEYTKQLDTQVKKNYKLLAEAYKYGFNEHKIKWKKETEEKRRERELKKKKKPADLEVENTQKSEKSLQVEGTQKSERSLEVEKTQSGIEIV